MPTRRLPGRQEIAAGAARVVEVLRPHWSLLLLLLVGGGLFAGLVAASGSLAMTAVGKAVVARERPDMSLAVPPFEVSAAFPSGHTLNATVIAGVLAYLVVIRVRSMALSALVVVLAVLHAVLMGLSRVYLGHHWLTDIVVAWCLGGAWLALVITTHQLLLHRVARRPQVPGSTATVTP